MYVVDSSRYGTTFNCPRERFLSTEWGGRGIESVEPKEELIYGLAVHKGTELLSSGAGFDEAFLAAQKELEVLPNSLTTDKLSHITELNCLLYGHVRSFQELILPKLQEEYEFTSSEQEAVIPLSPEVTYLTRFDNILRRKSDGLCFSLNYKTSSYLSSLYDSSEHSIQLAMEAHGAQLVSGADIAGYIIVGFDKGRRSPPSETEKKAGKTGYRRISPFTYHYCKYNDPWSIENDIKYSFKAGYSRMPNFHLVDGLGGSRSMMNAHWDKIPLDIKNSTYSILPPIMVSQDRIKDLKSQIVKQETVIRQSGWPQNWKNCHQHAGFIGHRCSFIPICWGGEDPEDLIGDTFQWRGINHEYEREFLPEEVRWV